MSYGQKALYYWWYLDAQVTNGGFVQFYYNGYGKYVPTIIKGLEHIGDQKMAALVRQADRIYQKNKKLIDKARQNDLFGSDLYERLEGLSALDKSYYESNGATMEAIEKFARRHPGDFFLGEDGNEVDMMFSGACKTFYENGQVKEVFTLEKGVITGVFRSFFEKGEGKEVIHYLQGQLTGEREEFFENGNRKYTVKKHADNGQLEHTWYYENGNRKKLECRSMDTNERAGAYCEWYDNGQLAKAGTYISKFARSGEWLEFYANGNKKLEADCTDDDFIVRNSWLENGEQTLTNGTGIHIYDDDAFSDNDHNEHEYKDGQRHGKQYTYTNGVIALYQEMENGKENGITRRYYDNGKLKEETLYKGGVAVSRKEFPLFENPAVATEIVCKMEHEWLTNRELPIADKYPEPTNAGQVAADLEIPISLFDGYSQDRTISYCYFVTVDADGNAINADFSFATNSRVTEQVKAAIQRIKFTPAVKDNRDVLSYVHIEFGFKLVEK